MKSIKILVLFTLIFSSVLSHSMTKPAHQNCKIVAYGAENVDDREAYIKYTIGGNDQNVYYGYIEQGDVSLVSVALAAYMTKKTVTVTLFDNDSVNLNHSSTGGSNSHPTYRIHRIDIID